jgi:hypothetical protein
VNYSLGDKRQIKRADGGSLVAQKAGPMTTAEVFCLTVLIMIGLGISAIRLIDRFAPEWTAPAIVAEGILIGVMCFALQWNEAKKTGERRRNLNAESGQAATTLKRGRAKPSPFTVMGIVFPAGIIALVLMPEAVWLQVLFVISVAVLLFRCLADT